ncbi:hypothetical protein [Symmachiella dynata]|uniref:hypothetical protein n=1 Tax=Symmachiella dynata TaxID=2527995 RepID=UPI0030EB76A5
MLHKQLVWSDTNVHRTTFSCDAVGQRTLKQLANGTRASLSYDDAGQTTALYNLKSGGAVVSSFDDDAVISEALGEEIGRRAYELNQKAGGKEGRRIVRKLTTDLVEIRMQESAMGHVAEYQVRERIELGLSQSTVPDDAGPDIKVRFVE